MELYLQPLSNHFMAYTETTELSHLKLLKCLNKHKFEKMLERLLAKWWSELDSNVQG